MRRVLCCGIVFWAAAAAAPCSAAAWPAWPQPGLPGAQSPLEEEERNLVERDYLRTSAEKFGKGSMATFKRELARLNLTPAKLMIALGAIGVLFTWNKNKRKARWAVLFLLFLVLLVVGVAASTFRWHPLA